MKTEQTDKTPAQMAAFILGGMRSEKKAISSRANGKKGGRPKGAKDVVKRKSRKIID